MNKEIQKSMERIKARESHLDRIRGCMIGGAVGDALGYPVEFINEAEISSRYGAEGITEYHTESGYGKAVITDDTQMALFTANGILNGDTEMRMKGAEENPSVYVQKAYMDWLRTQQMSYAEALKYFEGMDMPYYTWLSEVPELYKRRAPGNACLSALSIQKSKSISGSFIKAQVNDSKGCGGVMRVAPLALYYGDKDNLLDLDMEGAEIAAITHGHSLGYMPAAMLTHIISLIVFPKEKLSLKEIVLQAKNATAGIFVGDEHIRTLTALIDRAVTLSENGKPDLMNIHALGEGWVAEETLAIAVYCALRYQDDFSAGIIASVNHKGDSDSTGAVAGNILGALLGYEAIEDKWKKDLELKDVILEISDDLCRGCQVNENGEYRDEAWLRRYGRG